VIVIAHQAIGVAEPVKSLDDVKKNAEKELSIGFVLKDRLSLVAAGGDVVECSVVFDP
jgi:hypothetical protein